MKADMLLHRERLMELIYHVRDDILLIIKDDFASAQKAEVAYSLTKLSETLRFYDIKKVCMDLRKFDLHMLEEAEKRCADSFSSSMFHVRIQKVAWVAPEPILLEKKVKALSRYLLSKVAKDAAHKSFQDKLKAFCWLKSSPVTLRSSQ